MIILKYPQRLIHFIIFLNFYFIKIKIASYLYYYLGFIKMFYFNYFIMYYLIILFNYNLK
jgi:hypothetical protein